MGSRQNTKRESVALDCTHEMCCAHARCTRLGMSSITWVSEAEGTIISRYGKGKNRAANSHLPLGPTTPSNFFLSSLFLYSQ